MMYLILNLVFLAVIGMSLVFFRTQLNKQLLIALTIILSITAVFDSIFILLGIFEYEPTKILGIYIWKAPIEDFAYTVASILMVGVLWEYFEKKDRNNEV